MSEVSKEAVETARRIWSVRDVVAKSKPSDVTGFPYLMGEVQSAIDAATAPLREEIEKMTAWNKLTSLEITNLRSLYEEETSDLRARIRELEARLAPEATLAADMATLAQQQEKEQP